MIIDLPTEHDITVEVPDGALEFPEAEVLIIFRYSSRGCPRLMIRHIEALHVMGKPEPTPEQRALGGDGAPLVLQR